MAAVSRKTLALLGLLTLFAVGLSWIPARHARPATPVQALRVGLVFDVGGRGDKSFNDAAYLGLTRAERELGVQGVFLEPSGAEDREAALRLFASRGYDIIFGVGFIFSTDIDNVARDYPDRKFACIDYAPSAGGVPANVAALAFREEEGSYLVGGVAGMLSKSGHVGFIGGMTGPLIKKFELGFAAGVRETCPTCALHVGYAGSTPDAYRDPAKGKALAASQISLGTDVIYHASGATGHGVFEAAKDARIAAIGVDTDQHDEMPGVVVTSMVKRADVAVFETIRAVKEQRFRAGFSVLGLREGGVDYVSQGPHATRLDDTLRERVERMRAAVVSGQVQVPRE
jgi:basic membrane protein A